MGDKHEMDKGKHGYGEMDDDKERESTRKGVQPGFEQGTKPEFDSEEMRKTGYTGGEEVGHGSERPTEFEREDDEHLRKTEREGGEPSPRREGDRGAR